MTKNEVVRINLEGEDYIQINELTSRLIFEKKMTARKEKEAVILLALDVLGVLVARALSKGEKSFVPADMASIISDGCPVEDLTPQEQVNPGHEASAAQ